MQSWDCKSHPTWQILLNMSQQLFFVCKDGPFSAQTQLEQLPDEYYCLVIVD